MPIWSFSIQIEKVRDDLQDELIDLRNDSGCKDMFENLSICEFWAEYVFRTHAWQKYA